MQRHQKNSEREIVSEASSRLIEILSRVPFVRTEEQCEAGDKGYDLLLRVGKGKRQSCLVVQVKSHAQLRDVRLAWETLQQYCKREPGMYPVFCSQYLSPSARDFCQEHGLSFFDFAGNYRLMFDQVFIEREAAGSGPLEKKRLRSLFSPMAARVLRRLFSEPQRVWKVMALAEASGVSPATVSLVKDKLIGEEYASEGDGGVILQRPARLIKAWSSQYRYKDNVILEYFSRESHQELERQFSNYCRSANIEYAFTLFSGAARVAPFVRGFNVAHAYIPVGDFSAQIAEGLQIKLVDSGGNFCLLVPGDDDLLFGKQETRGEYVASDLQLYLDLASHPTRGEENAEFLLEQRLQPKW